MKIELKTKYIIIAILGLILASFLLGGYLSRRRAVNTSNMLILALRDSIHVLKINVHGANATAYQMSQVIVSQKQAIETALLDKEEMRKQYLKKVNELTLMEVTLKLARDSIKHSGKIITIHDTVEATMDQNAILLPFDFGENNKFYTLTGGFDSVGNMNIGLKVPVNISVFTGIQKKTNNPIVSVLLDNPLVTVNKIESIKLDSFKPQKWVIGAFVGYGITTHDPMKPSVLIGVGLSRSIIRF